MKKFIELTVTTTHEASELIADILWQHTDLGVVISDIEDVIELAKSGKNWDYADDSVFSMDKTVLIKAYFPIVSAKDTIKKIEKELDEFRKNSFVAVGSLECVKREIDGDLWHEQWKEHFKPLHIENVVVVPEWIKYDEKQGEIKVLLDSNMAFGTGEHETTSMCVAFLSKYVKHDMTVLDVGCGSGILGITASKLGAKNVIMTDIDECAITASNHNMKLNNVINGKAILKNLLDDNSVKGDIIVANIVADVLIGFSSKIGENLNENGVIILSGILTDRLEKVRSAYEKANFTFLEQRVLGEWSALVFKKGN